MKNKKKIFDSDLKENQKKLFMRIKSPSAFGASRRFDSVSFMNVPPELARCDAALSCIFDFFLRDDFPRQSVEMRREGCRRILKLLSMIEERAEFIRNAVIVEKRKLERLESLPIVRLLRNNFLILDNVLGIQLEVSAGSGIKKLIQTLPEKPLELQENGLNALAQQMMEFVRPLAVQVGPQLAAQREERCKQFSKSDSERYERAYAFYLDFYRDLKNV